MTKTARTLNPENDRPIILVVISGLGGLPSGPNLLTELQQAHRPHLNALARRGVCGLLHPAGRSIIPTPGRSLLPLLGYPTAAVSPFHKRFRLSALACSDDAAAAELLRRRGFAIRPALRPEADLRDAVARPSFILIHDRTVQQAALTGDYYEKVKAIEALDALLPALLDLQPAVVAVTGDVSIPTTLKAPSWHPLPLVLHSPLCRFDAVASYDEMACIQGGLGQITGLELMPLLMASAGKIPPPAAAKKGTS